MICSRCNGNKEPWEFYEKRNGTRAKRCKECDNAATRASYNKHKDKRNQKQREWYHAHSEEVRSRSRANYAANKEIVSERSKARRRTNVEFVRTYKAGKPCVDCKIVYNPWVMDFDHRDPSDKEANICTLAAGGCSMRKLMKEIAKCDLVCANCHRERTYRAGFAGRITSPTEETQ